MMYWGEGIEREGGRVFIDCVRGIDSQYSKRTSNKLKHCGDRKGLRMSVHFKSRNHEAVTGIID